ncbi:MAG: hypothetical protein QXG02_00295 [Candidatus Anstonellales archaeon]
MEMFIVGRKEADRWKEKRNVLVLDPEKVSLEGIQLAYALAKKAFEEKKNIATSFHMEFALWLSGKTNISSALKELSPNGERALVLDFNSKKERIARGIRKNATWQEIERISLSRL